MSRFNWRVLAAAVTIGVGLAAAPARAQTASTTTGVYIDIVVPFTLRDIHPAIVSVSPNCVVGISPMGLQNPSLPKQSLVVGETSVARLTKGADGSYSGTLTERLLVTVPTDIAGKPGAYRCSLVAKTLSGQEAPFQAYSPGSVSVFHVATGTTVRVDGTFIW